MTNEKLDNEEIHYINAILKVIPLRGRKNREFAKNVRLLS